MPACAATPSLVFEGAVEILEYHRPAPKPLLVVVGSVADAGNQCLDTLSLGTAKLAVLEVDVVHVSAIADSAASFSSPARAISTSKVQRSPSWVNSASNMSKRTSPGLGV